jgi:FtsP/CotA-like multicopper oxidase with cupredoxin domain
MSENERLVDSGPASRLDMGPLHLTPRPARPAPADGSPAPHPIPEGALMLTVQYATGKIRRTGPKGEPLGWDVVKLRSYNGKLVGPVIEARPGDTLNIFLDNHLPPEPASGEHDVNTPHGFNITNLHFHGLHVSPAGNSDNVMLAFEPGQQFYYEVKIPDDHPAGTYWYHGHKHGSVAIQLASGMAGALIIRGDIDEVPAIKAAREKIFLFQQIPYAINPQTKVGEVEGYAFAPPGTWKTLGRRITINGEVEPTVEMRPGEVQRWRFIHGGTREGLRVRLVKRSMGAADVTIPQHQIAMDGITTGRLDQVQETELHPGYRADVLVSATDAQGNPLPKGVYWLVDTSPDAPAHAKVLARVVVTGLAMKMKLPLPKELAPLAPFKNVADQEITGTQECHFDIDVQSTPPRFLINGKPFDPDDPPRRLTLGKVEEWIVSSTEIAGHPFHIHVNPFQCTLPDGRVVWKDTIFVPPGQEIRLRTRYERYIGTFVLHCHILPHEDLGMMQAVEIVPPGSAHDHGGHGGGGNGAGGHLSQRPHRAF